MRLIYNNFLDLDQISVDMIDRIEVFRGPTSALYGSDAIGSVVNIITKKLPQELAMGTTFQYGISTYGERAKSLLAALMFAAS